MIVCEVEVSACCKRVTTVISGSNRGLRHPQTIGVDLFPAPALLNAGRRMHGVLAARL